MTEYAEKHGRREAAEHFNVGRPTIDAHMSAWRDDLDHSREIQFSGATPVTDRMCSMMRILADDGMNLREIAEEFDVAHTTAQRHVSARSSCQHDGDVSPPRVEFDWGGG
jgi:transposase